MDMRFNIPCYQMPWQLKERFWNEAHAHFGKENRLLNYSFCKTMSYQFYDNKNFPRDDNLFF